MSKLSQQEIETLIKFNDIVEKINSIYMSNIKPLEKKGDEE